MADIKSMLDDEIEKKLESLNDISDGEEASKVIRYIVQLEELRIAEIKVQIEAEEKNAEKEKALLQIRDNKIDRWVKIGVSAVGLGVKMLFDSLWMKRGFEFERTGLITSSVFKSFASKFYKPAK